MYTSSYETWCIGTEKRKYKVSSYKGKKDTIYSIHEEIFMPFLSFIEGNIMKSVF